MALRQEIKEMQASKMPGTSKNIQFVKQLADLENQDYQKAKVIYDAKE